jgi:hypothetical protein
LKEEHESASVVAVDEGSEETIFSYTPERKIGTEREGFE